MHKLKVIAGLFLILGIAKEYVSASKQLFTFLDPGILIAFAILIAGCAWLIGTGVNESKIPFKSWLYAKYLGGTLLIFIVFFFIQLITFRFPSKIISANGIEVDIASAINSSRLFLDSEEDRVRYCTCLAERITADADIRQNYAKQLSEGNIEQVLNELGKNGRLETLAIQNCFEGLNTLKWTSALEQGLREGILANAKESGIDKTNNLKDYCDCLLEAYKRRPLGEVLKGSFQNSEFVIQTDSLCKLRTKLK